MPDIILRKLDLAGYTTETQFWLVENGGGPRRAKVAQFIADDLASGHLIQSTSGYGVRGIEAARFYRDRADALGFSAAFA
jgi:hypothetical protein